MGRNSRHEVVLKKKQPTYGIRGMSPDVATTPSQKPPQRKKSAASIHIPKHLKMVAEKEMNNNSSTAEDSSNNNITKGSSFSSKSRSFRRRTDKKPRIADQKPETTKSVLSCKGHAKSTRVRRIQGSNGFFLEVLCEGLIRGTVDGSSEYGVFHLFSVGPNKTVVRNIMTGLHIAIEDGHLITKEIPDRSCVLDEILLDRFLVAYQTTDASGKTYSVSIEETGTVSAKPMNTRGKNSTMLFKTLLLSPKDFDYYFSLANSLDYSV